MTNELNSDGARGVKSARKFDLTERTALWGDGHRVCQTGEFGYSDDAARRAIGSVGYQRRGKLLRGG